MNCQAIFLQVDKCVISYSINLVPCVLNELVDLSLCVRPPPPTHTIPCIWSTVKLSSEYMVVLRRGNVCRWRQLVTVQVLHYTLCWWLFTSCPMSCTPLQSPDLSSEVLWRIVVQVLSESPSRAKLPNVNTIEDVVDLVQSCSNILVITGAGVSQSHTKHDCTQPMSMHSNSPIAVSIHD